VAYEMNLFEAEILHYGIDIPNVLLYKIPLFRLVRQASASKVHSQDPVIGGES